MFKFLSLLSLAALPGAYADLKLSAKGEPDNGAVEFEVTGLSKEPFCDFTGNITVDSMMGSFPLETWTYEVEHVSENYWFGPETLPYGGDLKGYASLYVTGYDESKHCFLSGSLNTYHNGVIGLKIRTEPDGRVFGDIVVPPPEHAGTEPQVAAAMAEASYGHFDDGSVIDVLVPFTKEAYCAEAGLAPDCEISILNSLPIKTKIKHWLAEANHIFSISKLDLSLNIVKSYLLSDYVEDRKVDDAAELVGPLAALTDETRDSFCADLVHVIFSKPFKIGHDLLLGFSTVPDVDGINHVLVTSVDPESIVTYIWTRETGHMLGATTDQTFVDPAHPPKYATIMATEHECDVDDECWVLPVFSGGADFTFGGLDLGDAHADNQKAIMANQKKVANYKLSKKCAGPPDERFKGCAKKQKEVYWIYKDLGHGTFADAMAASPEDCTLAPVFDPCDLLGIQAVIPPGKAAWTAVYKNAAKVYYDAHWCYGEVGERCAEHGDDVCMKMRGGWYNTGAGIGDSSVSMDVWPAKEPMYCGQGAVQNVGVVYAMNKDGSNKGDIRDASPASTLPGAVYQCCIDLHSCGLSNTVVV